MEMRPRVTLLITKMLVSKFFFVALFLSTLFAVIDFVEHAVVRNRVEYTDFVGYFFLSTISYLLSSHHYIVASSSFLTTYEILSDRFWIPLRSIFVGKNLILTALAIPIV